MLRTYGKSYNADGSYTWIEVTTDANGYNDAVYLTTLCQVCLLNLGESPFFGQFGIPAQQSVLQQTYPDYYLALTQQYFAQFFASVRLSRALVNIKNRRTPVYSINVITNQGAIVNLSQPIPQ